MISERLDNSNEKCKPMFGFVHKNLVDFHPKIPGSNPCFLFQSLRSTKHELLSVVDFDGVIGGVFFILFL